MLSVYDYLGKAGGPVLCHKIQKYASVREQKYTKREVSHKGFNGVVNLYTKEFLDEFFQVQEIFNS